MLARPPDDLFINIVPGVPFLIYVERIDTDGEFHDRAVHIEIDDVTVIWRRDLELFGEFLEAVDIRVSVLGAKPVLRLPRLGGFIEQFRKLLGVNLADGNYIRVIRGINSRGFQPCKRFLDPEPA